ncbi:hypothetical protein [Yinghuangia aomiensis]|uniref:RICIN domain-containing protein n=1 Tax=Yinghuangia aomiensis TaxID=676205 RepID=UPI0031EC2193
MSSQKSTGVIRQLGIAVGALLLLLGLSVPQAQADTGPLRLRNAITPYCVGLPGDGSNPGAKAITEDCDSGGSNRYWTFQNTSLVDYFGRPTFVIANNATPGQCLDIPDLGAPHSGDIVGMYGCNKTRYDNQEFIKYYPYANDDRFALQSVKDLNMCLDVSGWAYNGSDWGSLQSITMYPCTGTGGPWTNYPWDDHLWYQW